MNICSSGKMKKESLNKEIAERLMKTEGEGRGMNLKDDAEFVSRKEGKEGLKRLEEELKKIGCPIKYEKLRRLDFYPLGWRAISLLAIKKVFGWRDKEFRELGGFTVSFPLIIKIYMKLFHSPETIIKRAPKMYHEYFTKGELTISDYSEEKKYAIVEIRDLSLHPIFCLVVEGYLENIVRMVVGIKEVKCQETKCSFRGDEYHEYLIEWE